MYDTIPLQLERPRTIKLKKFSLVIINEETHYTRDRSRWRIYYTILVEGGRTIQGDVLIEENALNEVVR